MRINTNLTAMNTYTQYTKNNSKISSAVAKLSSGYAINTAADNAAGLAISEKMRAQIRGLQKASANAQDAISLIQTAEGALSESTEILQRMRELAVQSASDTNEGEIDRAALQDEFAQLQKELDDIAKNTTFNKKNLLDGSLASTKLSVGSNTVLSGVGMTVSLGNAKAGIYNFNVSVKTTQAAVTAAAPDTGTINVSSLSSAFDGANSTVAIGGSAEASSLLNGNYTLSATYDTVSKKFTVTATGDNGQVFTKELTSSDYDDLASGDDLAITFETYSGAADAFTVTLRAAGNLTSATATDNELANLANSITGTTFTISGGVDAVEQKQALFASLTGAEDVELKVGMESVAFSNGITVSFNKLTAADLDTSGTAYQNVFGSAASTIEVVAAANAGITFQVGANEGDALTINIDKMDSQYLGVNGVNIATREDAGKAVTAVDKAINKVSSQRAYLGAIQNRLDHKIANLETTMENLTSAESQIRDVDMAREMTNFTNANILQQAATAMLAQANALPQNVLSLIGK